ncbi:Ig-like domain-containing protein [Cohnella faecalis]|uniref:SLH domain-containing protein n=1 Tax=Cohnella faecalis TaxID=2315694 RepID=A0A398CJH4_9BACL|nr:Ig-like domain-containing protein [Cohnella faecalis]RIE02505.1 hypothetical protein D3H35_17600 [Cohnella faecalis]
MKKFALAILALSLLLGAAIPAAWAAELTTEQKFEALKKQGILVGMGDGNPRLYELMTREQFAQVLHRLLELPNATGKPTYSDVLKGRWSFDEIEAVTEAGLMVGTAPRKFSPAATVTVEQLASVLVRAYGSPAGAATVSGKVSNWARMSVGAALNNGFIASRSDYTAGATRGVLVDAVYAYFVKTQQSPLNVRSVEPITNQAVKINLLQRAETVDASLFLLQDSQGTSIPVYQAMLGGDGMYVILTTGTQAEARKHYVYVGGKAWEFTSTRSDTAKPLITGLTKSANRTYVLTFSEQLDQASAANPSNYSLSNGLKLKTLQLSADKMSVVFTTTTQSEGVRYYLTVKNVKDAAGNAMDTRSDLSFNGTNDDTKPKVSSVQINPSATLSVRFSEKVDPQLAIQTGRYKIDKGLSVLKAVIDGEGRTVTLTTSAQKDATVYTLTVSGIPDAAGNVMDTQTNLLFGGIANPVLPIRLQSISAIDENTVEIVFADRALTDSDIAKLNFVVLQDNGANISMSGWSRYVQRKAGSDRTVTVQIRTSGEANPRLFSPGHYYLGRVTGVESLLTDEGKNDMKFGGTVTSNEAPFVTKAVALSRSSVKVFFSEPVKNVNETSFAIQEQEGPAVAIDYDELNNTGAVVTEVILRLKDSLSPGKVYAMTFKQGVTDAAGWNGLKLKNGGSDFNVLFTGI